MMSSVYGSPTFFSSPYPLILLLSLVSLIRSGPSPYIFDHQVKTLDTLTGTRISALFQSDPDLSEGSTEGTPSASRDRRSLSEDVPVGPELEPRQALPGLLLDFMGRQRKFKGRTRKSTKCLALQTDLFRALSSMSC